MGHEPGTVTLSGQTLTLVGRELEPGDPAPRVELLSPTLDPVDLIPRSGVRIISVVPSLDTPVCDTQTRRFNAEASKLPDGIDIVSVSVDLPFAQARWLQMTGADHIGLLSDHRELAFGEAYGVRIRELRLDSRAVFVVDRGGRIAHAEYVRELAEPPDYQAALEAARRVSGS